jgi:hypothetical protein
MNSRESRPARDGLDARIRHSLRAAYGNKYPARGVRRQLLDRAAEQRRDLRKLVLPLPDWLGHSRDARPVESGWNHLDYISLLSALGFVGVTYAIR